MISHIASSRHVISGYVSLTKPRILTLLLFTALAGMFLASEGNPNPTTVLLVLAGGAMAAGGAHSLNHFFDKDIDALMERTQGRPVTSGRISPRKAVTFGIGLNLTAFFLLYVTVNPLTAYVTLSGTLIYIFVYTLGLKRLTPQSIVIGGAAGAVPPIAGWTAVMGSIDLPAIYLFAIIFFWTPPHFWALSLLIKDDYSKAGVPMLPVVKGVSETKKSIFLYTILLFALTLMFFTTGAVGWVYLISATILGFGFIYSALQLWRKPKVEGAKATYLYSLAYLGLLFLAIIFETTLII